MPDNLAFDNPVSAGTFDLRVTHLNKIIPFKTLKGVFLGNASVQVKSYDDSSIVKTYNIGTGLTIIGTNVVDTEKTLQCLLQGTDFAGHEGKTLLVNCLNFFINGDLEITFKLKIV